MFPAQAAQSGGVRRTHRVGDGVVDVTVFGRSVTARESAGQIAATHEPLQRPGPADPFCVVFAANPRRPGAAFETWARAASTEAGSPITWITTDPVNASVLGWGQSDAPQ